VERQVRAAIRQPVDATQVIVAAGGDGTINLVARIVIEQGVTLGVIPLGTFNYLARHLGIPLVPREAAHSIASGIPRPVHVGRINGHLFLNNASFGLYQALLEEREQMKQRFGRYKLVAVAAGLGTLWNYRRVYNLRMELDGKPTQLRTPMVFFGLNSLQFENLGMDAAACTQAGMLAVIVLRSTSRWTLLGMALRGVLHRLHGTTDLRTHCAGSVEVKQAGARRAKVAVDGESVTCTMPLQVELVRDGLRVVAPIQPEERK
jgi:diacylglycerol kinase family enzyme